MNNTTQRMTMHKWIWVWEFEKEEAWLNEMAAAGWVLDGVGFCTYRFVRMDEAYTVRLELHDSDPAYLQFMADTGAEYIGRMVKWIYFRKPVSEGAFELFSDLDSRIAHLNRIGKMLSAVGVLNLGVGILNSVNTVGAGWINLLCATVLMYGLGRIHGKREELEKSRRLYE